ncbi:MAG: hypothetical protein HYT93_04015 [Parcubacteria group bacterium]|nr:hypothetical protein [Parcubacteria group bacterium]
MQNQNRELWFKLWERIGACTDSRTVYKDLAARYSESHRAYHTLEHINHCLFELEKVRRITLDVDVIELAIWFHDAVYDTHASDNEEQSALLAAQVMREAALPERMIKKVTEFIRATKHTHGLHSHDIDLYFFLDIDLSILGQTQKVFDAYELQIRKEYEWVPEEAFIEGRKVVLSSFLNREHIYSTHQFYDAYEAQARENIARSLVKLSPTI